MVELAVSEDKLHVCHQVINGGVSASLDFAANGPEVHRVGHSVQVVRVLGGGEEEEGTSTYTNSSITLQPTCTKRVQYHSSSLPPLPHTATAHLFFLDRLHEGPTFLLLTDLHPQCLAQLHLQPPLLPPSSTAHVSCSLQAPQIDDGRDN